MYYIVNNKNEYFTCIKFFIVFMSVVILRLICTSHLWFSYLD